MRYARIQKQSARRVNLSLPISRQPLSLVNESQAIKTIKTCRTLKAIKLTFVHRGFFLVFSVHFESASDTRITDYVFYRYVFSVSLEWLKYFNSVFLEYLIKFSLSFSISTSCYLTRVCSIELCLCDCQCQCQYHDVAIRMLDQKSQGWNAGRCEVSSNTSCILKYAKSFIMQKVSVYNERLTNLSRTERYLSRNLGQHS